MSREASTRRNLPHWRLEGAVYWITFRLADSLPQARVAQLVAEKAAWLARHPEPWTQTQKFDYERHFGKRVQDWLDAGYGSCVLAKPEIRRIVRDCLSRFDGQRLQLHAAVIMPNHVHALIEPMLSASDTGIPACADRRETGIPACDSDSIPQTRMSVSRFHLSALLKGIKGASARAANDRLGRKGPLWMDESYDRIVRDDREYAHFFHYIAENPKKAHLRPDQYWLYFRGHRHTCHK